MCPNDQNVRARTPVVVVLSNPDIAWLMRSNPLMRAELSTINAEAQANAVTIATGSDSEQYSLRTQKTSSARIVNVDHR
jgi:hypothetical protein